MKKVELLAPCGDLDSLKVAVNSGANAVYLGGRKFSARAYASNFNEENLKLAVEYSHNFGVKVYVTVNTLIKQNEIKEALEYIKFLYEIGVDAIIIQDLGLVYLIHKYFKDLELHASTQMTIHNGEGAKLLKEFGLTRIVLSRELSLEEIETISKELGIETEIFIHGALCVCYSGQCLMSSIIGGRSGNRGRCAQPCRLPYSLIDKLTGKEKQGYILSPKDICTIENIKDIVKSGASSLKIEGRMKRPEYVAGVVSTYRKAIDNLEKSVSKTDYKKLKQLFNREGFSKAYLFSNDGKDMMAYSFPKNTGIVLGKAISNNRITLQESISLKDGVRIKECGFTVSKIIKNGKEVEEAFAGDIVELKPCKYREGDMLYKTLDNKLMSDLNEVYGVNNLKRININLEVEFCIDKPILIKTKFQGEEFKILGDLVQKAEKRPITKERLEENLKKTKDSYFNVKSINFIHFEEGFMPMSSINKVRRDLIDLINEYIKVRDKRKIANINFENIYNGNTNINDKINKSQLFVTVTTQEQLKAVMEYGVENIAVDIFNKNNSINIDNIKDKNVYLKIPNIIKKEFNAIVEKIESVLENINGIVTSNLGIINKFKGKTKIIGDYKLNIFNSFALDFYKEYVDSACLSVELNKNEISDIIKHTNQSCQLLVYGKIELMVSEYCPIGSIFGGKDKISKCNNACAKGNFILKDRKGVQFQIITDKYCRSHIYNNVPLNLIPNIKELEKFKLDYIRLDFIDEDYSDVKNVLDSLNNKNTKQIKDYTRGHFKRGVQ